MKGIRAGIVRDRKIYTAYYTTLDIIKIVRENLAKMLKNKMLKNTWKVIYKNEILH